MALTDLTRISTSGIATGSTIDSPILRKDVDYRGSQVGVTSVLFDSSDNSLKFKDSAKAKFGTGNDLEIYGIASDGTAAIINHANGDLLIKHGADKQLISRDDGSVELYFDDNQKFRTTNDGAVVTGILTATSFSGGGGISAGVVTCTGLDLNGNGDVSGNFVIGGDLTVNGTTTTLDTNLTEVDRIEVGANSNTLAGIAVTQSGSADIVNLFDGNTEVLTVIDGGKVGIGITNPLTKIDVNATNSSVRLRKASASNYCAFQLDRDASGTEGGYLGLAGGNTQYADTAVQHDLVLRSHSNLLFTSGGTTERLRITSGGVVAIGTNNPTSGAAGARLVVHLDDNTAYAGGTNRGNGIFVYNEAAGGHSSLELAQRNAADTYGSVILNAVDPPAGNNYGAEFTIQTRAAGGGSYGERFRITSGGNVGIGSAIPSQKLDVNGISNFSGQLRVSDGSTSLPSVAAASDTDSGLYFAGANSLGLVSGGSRKLLVNSSGVTINNGDLAVNGGNLDVTGDIRHIDNTNTKISFTSNQIDFQAAGASRFYINNYGLYVESGRALAFLATGGGATPHIKSGGTNAQDLLFTAGTGNPTRLHIKSDGNVGIATDLSGGGGAYGRLSVVIPSQSGGSALQVMNSAVGSGDGSLTNIVLRSVNNLGTQWAGAEYRAHEHIFKNQGTEALRIHGDGEVEIKEAAAGQTVLSMRGLYSTGNHVDIATFARSGGAVKTAIRYNDPTTSMRFGTTTAHDFGLMTGGTERLHVSSTGDVGIGTDSPVRALTVHGPGQIHLENTTTGSWVGTSLKGSSGTNNYNAYFGILDSNGNFFIDNGSNGDDFVITQAGLIHSNRQLVVGGTSAQASDAVTLMPDGEVTAAGFYFSNNIGSPMNSDGFRRHTTGTLCIDTASEERIRINSSGRVGINTTTDSMAGVTGNLNIANDNFNNHTVINLSRNTTADRPQIRFQNPNGNVGYVGTFGSDLVLSSGNDLILRANGTEKARINSTGQVGINEDNPKADLHIKNHTNSWEGGLLLEDSNDTTGWNLHPDTNDTLMIGRNQDTSVSLTSQVATHIASFNDNGLSFVNGKGIDFGATSNHGTATPDELLDDYEEGTWTPTIKSISGTDPTISYTKQDGRYTKIGNVVHLFCFIDIGAGNFGTDGTGDGIIDGLPYTISNNPASSDCHGSASDNLKSIPNTFSSQRNNAKLFFANGAGNIRIHQYSTDNPIYETGWSLTQMDNGDRFKWGWTAQYRTAQS